MHVGEGGASRRPFASSGPDAPQSRAVKTQRAPIPDFEVGDVERLQGMDDGEVLAEGAAVAGRGRLVHGVEECSDGNCRRRVEAGAGVPTGVDDHQPLLGRQHRVEQQLPILTARVAVAHPVVASRDVVTVGSAASREHAVVHPEQAHHPVRYGPHGQHGAHGEGARTKVGPGGPASEGIGQQARYVDQRQLGIVVADRIGDPGQLGVRVPELPVVRPRHGGEQVDRLLEDVDPSRGGARLLAGLHHELDPAYAFAEPADQLDVAGVDVVQGQGCAEEVLAGLVHGDPEQQPVQTRRPGVLTEATHPEPGAMGGHRGPSAHRTVPPGRAAAPGSRC